MFDGYSYFVYSHNDYCNSEPKWIQAPKNFSPNLIPSTTTSTTTRTTPSTTTSTTTSTTPSTTPRTTPSTKPSTIPRTCTKDSTESDILEVLDYPVARFSVGEWISGMGNFKIFVKGKSDNEGRWKLHLISSSS